MNNSVQLTYDSESTYTTEITVTREYLCRDYVPTITILTFVFLLRGVIVGCGHDHNCQGRPPRNRRGISLPQHRIYDRQHSEQFVSKASDIMPHSSY